jgi:cysteinyl-tRNA synthetase
MWVAAGPRRELVYDSPWGSGYPGWHIECSAMSLHYFGERFDVHTGGIDNRFPHHEDEIAQSEGAVGHEVVGTWAHGEHLLMAQAKMAKSAGNVVTISTLMDQGYDPIAFRYLCFTARYRRQVHFTDEALAAAATALRRLREQVAALGGDGAAASTDEALRSVVTDPTALSAHDRFVHALDDDLDLPQALRVLHELIGNDTVAPHVRRTLIASWDNVLGLHLAGADDLSDELRALIAEREAARKARDYARSDAIRDRLRNEGIDLLDSASGTTWTRRRLT